MTKLKTTAARMLQRLIHEMVNLQEDDLRIIETETFSHITLEVGAKNASTTGFLVGKKGGMFRALKAVTTEIANRNDQKVLVWDSIMEPENGDDYGLHRKDVWNPKHVEMFLDEVACDVFGRDAGVELSEESAGIVGIHLSYPEAESETLARLTYTEAAVFGHAILFNKPEERNHLEFILRELGRSYGKRFRLTMIPEGQPKANR